jgi:hypothetical protein
VRIVEVRRRRNDRVALAGRHLPVGGVATDLGEVRRRQVVGVAEHRVGHRTECRCEAEVFGPLAAECQDELGGLLADVLDVVQRPRVDVEHLACADGEVACWLSETVCRRASAEIELSQGKR